MQYLSIFLGLLATVSAIDVRSYGSGDCTGASNGCGGLNPNGYSANGDNRCGTLRAVESIGGANFACLRRSDWFSGAGWNFRSRLAARETSSQKADMVILEDGNKYTLEGMEDAMLIEMIQLAMNGTITADIPADFKKFEIEE
ncbi:hypothetical protein K458DRAFT_404134 [Lentithecium fluviatile CBS 122367]|uniref:Uncharacterized protein n=1 Tax=Lentithecium fluviatile CBS 122367 TaxID=1168545 RepID=A0A6G1J294_9PLEO|nr:hypothetical protein K458DRAFT_404134 [Lentithecium fluviatile CBS 122367]